MRPIATYITLADQDCAAPFHERETPHGAGAPVLLPFIGIHNGDAVTYHVLIETRGSERRR
jgi:hypothetical protein